LANRGIAPHETFEVHEILTFKNVCATKSATMSGLAKDEELKELLRNDFSVSQGHIRELQGLLQQSDLTNAWTTGATTGTTTTTVTKVCSSCDGEHVQQ
jgi:similar to spore coat protein